MRCVLLCAFLLEEVGEANTEKVTVDTSSIFSLIASSGNLYFSCKRCCKKEKKNRFVIRAARVYFRVVCQFGRAGSCRSAGDHLGKKHPYQLSRRISYYVFYALLLFLEADPSLPSLFTHSDA